jgi:hypothetical protein
VIVFDLACGQAHVFEAWFGSSAAFEEQNDRGLVACPICGDTAVVKAVMAPAVAAKGNSRDLMPVRSKGPPAPAEMKAMLAALARAQAKALEGSEHVGTRFVEEARAIHAGDADARPIHGQATIADAKAMVADGIAVAPLPLPVPPPAGTTH